MLVLITKFTNFFSWLSEVHQFLSQRSNSLVTSLTQSGLTSHFN